MKEEKKSCIFINISEKKKYFKQEKYKHMYIFIH